jgi:hypothetical protein
VRYGHVYFGRPVADYLGSSRAPAITRIVLGSVSVLVLGDCVGELLAYCIGVSSTLAQASGISASIWVLLLLAVVLYFLRRKPLMAAYFGHFSTGTCARLVLSRDPSGRSLLLGNVAAMGVAIVLNCVWVIVVSGTLPSAALAGESGTAFNLLATEVGPFVSVIGMVYVILSMGMGSIHVALCVVNQMREWRSGFLVGALPVVLIFALAEWLLTAHTSFAAPLGVVGVLSLSVLGGVLPVLLLLASRRKGEYVPAAFVVVTIVVIRSGAFRLHQVAPNGDPAGQALVPLSGRPYEVGVTL